MTKLNFFRTRNGFARAEICAFLGAAAIIAALAFPSLNSAREAASKSTRNRDNLRAIYGAMQAYLADNDKGFMPAGTRRTGVYWWGKVTSDNSVDYKKGPLFSYLKSVAVLRSPAFHVNRRPVVGGLGYAYNGKFIGGSFFESEDDTPENVRPAQLNQIRNPHRTILFADSARWNNFRKGAPQLEENVFIEPAWPEKYPTFHGRHRGYGHVLFVDGSIAAFRPLAGGVPDNWSGPKDLGHLPSEWFDRD